MTLFTTGTRVLVANKGSLRGGIGVVTRERGLGDTTVLVQFEDQGNWSTTVEVARIHQILSRPADPVRKPRLTLSGRPIPLDTTEMASQSAVSVALSH